jgi:hypothetical protein
MIELLLRVLYLHIFLGFFKGLGFLGYKISRVIVPILSDGRVGVVPPPNNYEIYPRWHGLHRLSDGSLYMGKGLAGLCGVVFALLVSYLIVLIFIAIHIGLGG